MYQGDRGTPWRGHRVAGVTVGHSGEDTEVSGLTAGYPGGDVGLSGGQRDTQEGPLVCQGSSTRARRRGHWPSAVQLVPPMDPPGCTRPLLVTACDPVPAVTVPRVQGSVVALRQGWGWHYHHQGAGHCHALTGPEPY